MSTQNTITKHQAILHESLIGSFADYEQNNPVDDYTCFDWNCWPLLRIIASYQLSIHTRRESATGLRSLLERYFRDEALETPHTLVASKLYYLYNKALALRKKKELKRVLGHDTCHSVSPDAPGHEIVILTQSGRRTMLDGKFFDIYSDPIIQNFQGRNLSPMVWEQGSEKWPRHSNSAWITRQLAIELEHNGHQLQRNPPEWFLEFTHWLKNTHNHVITWDRFRRTINLLQSRSIVFKKWLDSCGTRLLISVCWYDPLVMAATLAAKRTGIATVDLQHGMQNNIHSAYTDWNHVPTEPYALIPDFFWSWGVNDAKRLITNNAAFEKYCKTFVGGNLWYNLWHEKDNLFTGLPDKAQNDTSGIGRILVTLQHGSTNFSDQLVEMIKKCPPGWFWMIRMHPATLPREREHIKDTLDALEQDNIDYEISTNTALYTLLSNCDIHITGHSTSALEALGFGVPTITATENGALAFREFIENGVMLAMKESSMISDTIKIAASIPKSKCREYSKSIFAPTADANSGIDTLLSAANIQW